MRTCVVLVLDDLWEAKLETSLNCIDPDDSSSRVLVTTRIRGVLKAGF